MKKHNEVAQPKGMLKASFEELFGSGCIQTGADTFQKLEDAEQSFAKRYLLLLGITRHNPCDGCPEWNGGRCLAYRKYHTQAQAENAKVEEIRQAAIRRLQPKTLSVDEERNFRGACAELGIEPTKRQRRKFTNKEGSAYKAHLSRSMLS